MQGGKYDSIYPIELNQRPFVGLFGTAEKDKQLRIHETGHALWAIKEAHNDEFDFPAKYLGPVT